MAASDDNLNVFINCPFDRDYEPLFDALVFAIIRCGFNARCAMEVDNATDSRFDKICAIIKDCRYGVHDISRTELDGTNGLPRFNMPFELGLFLGARHYGGTTNKGKSCLVLDMEQYRFQKFLSDIAGQDIRAHENSALVLVSRVSDYLRNARPDLPIPGGRKIQDDLAEFTGILPVFCEEAELHHEEVNFRDYVNMAAVWIKNKYVPNR